MTRGPGAAWRAVIAAALAAVVGCGGGHAATTTSTAAVAPATPAEKILAMLPQGAQVIIELDLARLRANPVVGEVVSRALAERVADLPTGLPASPLAAADQVVLAAYGVGTAQAATLTVLAAPRDVPGATKILDGFYAVGPPEWVEQVEQRVALASTGEAKLAIHAAPELLALRDRAMPPNAPGAALRLTARLSFDARVALARQTGLDAAPAQVSAWGDVADDLALIVDCDSADPGNKATAGKRSDAPKRLEAALRGALSAVAEQPAIRALGLPSSLAGAKLVTRTGWVRAIIAVGPTHLHRVVERALALLREATPDARAAPPASPSPASPSPASPSPGSSSPASSSPASPSPASPSPGSSSPASPSPLKSPPASPASPPSSSPPAAAPRGAHAP